MDKVSPAGWDIPSLCNQFGWDMNKIIFREDAGKRGVYHLNERYNALDVHGVLAFREGFGLPVLEAMAAGVLSFAQDWCAGTEVVGDGRGILVPSREYFMPSTWGGALDRLPNYDVLIERLQWVYNNPNERLAIAKRGMEWARQQTWDKSVDNAVEVINGVLEKRANHPLISSPRLT
jgi:glycosyltransferase involved in cell wall biosynthesis